MRDLGRSEGLCGPFHPPPPPLLLLADSATLPGEPTRGLLESSVQPSLPSFLTHGLRRSYYALLSLPSFSTLPPPRLCPAYLVSCCYLMTLHALRAMCFFYFVWSRVGQVLLRAFQSLLTQAAHRPVVGQPMLFSRTQSLAEPPRLHLPPSLPGGSAPDRGSGSGGGGSSAGGRRTVAPSLTVLDDDFDSNGEGGGGSGGGPGGRKAAATKPATKRTSVAPSAAKVSEIRGRARGGGHTHTIVSLHSFSVARVLPLRVGEGGEGRSGGE